MTTRAALPFTPRLMKAGDASAYLGMGRTKFMELVDAGDIPPPLEHGGLKHWDVRDLDSYVDALHDAPAAANDDPRPVRAI